LSFSAFLLLMALIYHDRERLGWRQALWFGLLTGLVLLSKRPFWWSFPLSDLIRAHRAFQLWQQDKRALSMLLWRWLPLVVLVAFLLILPQKIIYPLSQGDYAARVLEMREQRARVDLRPSATEYRGYLLREKGYPFSTVWASPVWWRMSFQSLYGYFGYWALQAPMVAYTGAPLLMLVGIACTYVDFMQRRWAYSTLTRILLVAGPFLSVAILFASLYYSWIFDFQPQGRYLMPAMLPLSLLIGGAVDDEPRRLRGVRLVMWLLHKCSSLPLSVTSTVPVEDSFLEVLNFEEGRLLPRSFAIYKIPAHITKPDAIRLPTAARGADFAREASAPCCAPADERALRFRHCPRCAAKPLGRATPHSAPPGVAHARCAVTTRATESPLSLA
jgi:hypothetical protein